MSSVVSGEGGSLFFWSVSTGFHLHASMSSGFGDLFPVLRESAAASSLASFDVAVSSSRSVSFESSDFSGPRLFRYNNG
jgi:hypothetical protein